jgi:hypothetical protein
MADDKVTAVESATSEESGIEQIRPADLPVFYSNNTFFQITPWDFTMTFGIIQEVKPGRLVIRDTATVIMSPHHAKVFSQVLADNVSKYEKRHGELKVPEDDSGSKTEP